MRIKNFVTDYESELEIVDEAIWQLKSLNTLNNALVQHMIENGASKDDGMTAFYLEALTDDVISGIEAFHNKKINERR